MTLRQKLRKSIYGFDPHLSRQPAVKTSLSTLKLLTNPPPSHIRSD